MTKQKNTADSPATLPKYRIGAVSRLTKLSVDVVRVWERRYHALNPQRSTGGSRLYSDADVERLRRLREAVESGYVIGQVAQLSDAELAQLMSPATSARAAETVDPYALVREHFLAALARFDLTAAGAELEQAAVLFAPRVLSKNIIAPLLVEIGDRWARQELGIAHEHAAVNLLRNLLTTLLRFYPPESEAETIVLATPVGERHELGLLLAALYAAMRGWRVVYLGADLPAVEIAAAVRLTKARVLALSLVASLAPLTVQELTELAQRLPAQTLVWLGGGSAATQRWLIERAGWLLLRGLDDLDEQLKH